MTNLPDRPCRSTQYSALLRILVDHLPVLVFVRCLTGPNKGTTCVWNATAELATGYPASQVLGRATREAFQPALAASLEALDRRMLADPMVLDQPDVPFHRPDGQTRLMHCICVPLFNEHDQPEFLLCIAQDMTGQRQKSRALAARQAALSAVHDASPLGLFQADCQGRCTHVNRRFELISGLSQQAACGHGWLSAIHPQDRHKVFASWRAYRHRLAGAAAQTESHAHPGAAEAFQLSFRFRHTNGRIVWASMKTAPVIVDGRIHAWSGTIDDITAHVQNEQLLAESEQRLRTVADTLPALVAWVDRDLRLRFANRAWEDEFARPGQDIKNLLLADLLDPLQYQALLPQLQRALAGEKVVFERELGAADEYRCIESTFIPQYSEQEGQVVGLHLLLQDVTASKLEQLRLQRLAELDSLTGLYNREGFKKRMTAALAGSATRHSLVAVMFLDLDHFKQVNDTWGHHTGDLLLQAFARRLTQSLRTSDTIGRMGGDEFTVIMEDLPAEEYAEAIANKIVQAVQTPFYLEGANISISVSVGLAFCRNGNVDPNVLLQRADAMLYDAKQDGRNLFRSARPDRITA